MMRLRESRIRRVLLPLASFIVSLSASCAAEVDVEKLYTQANSDDYEERVEARQKLGQLVEKGEVEPFAKGLRSPNAETRVQSILHLLAIQSPESKKPLVDELELSRRFNVFYNPIRLVQVSTPSDSRIMVAHILQMKGGDSRAAPILAKSYGQEPDVGARVATIYALGALQDPGAAPALEKGLRDAEVKVVSAALEGLNQLRTPGLAAILLKGLSDSSDDVRANSATVLAGFHDPGVGEALLQALQKDPSMKVRLAALGALPNAGGPSVFAPILNLLKNQQTPRELREKAATALQSLTAQDFGQDAVRWARWWDQNKAALGR